MWMFKKKKLPKGSISYSNPNQPEEPVSVAAITATEFVVVGALVIIILFIFNYFNIIPVSQIFSDQLGFLPHQAGLGNKRIVKVMPTPATASNAQTLPYISCPVPADQCKNGKAVVEDVNGGKRYGVKFTNLNQEASVSAAISGRKTKEGQNTILITNSERGIELKYVWIGDFKVTDQVNAASAVAEKQVMGNFSNAVNTLTVYAASIITKTSVKLGVAKDGKYLTNNEGL